MHFLEGKLLCLEHVILPQDTHRQGRLATYASEVMLCVRKQSLFCSKFGFVWPS